MKKPNGYILFEGPSKLTGKPIVCIAIGFKTPSTNIKTGGMIQTYILCAHENPIAAAKNGNDTAICGGCIHRYDPFTGKRTCYVTLMHGPLGVWKSYQKGNYPVLPDYSMFDNRPVRFGTYGDPAAVPLSVWQNISAYAKMTTGYTHQWRSAKFSALSYFCQASVETAEEVIKANSKGFGTFRVLPVIEPITTAIHHPTDAAIHCPASKEQGHKTTCVDCGVCDGASQHNVVILAHGASRNQYTGVR